MEVRCRVNDCLLKYLTDGLLLCLICLMLYGMNPVLMDPFSVSSRPEYTSSFTLLPFAFLFLASYTGGELASHICLPKALGMIVAGIIVRNTTNLQFNLMISSLMRSIAFTTILLEAGLGMDVAKVAASSATALSLCFVPLFADTLIMSGMGFWILNLPYVWSLMLGFILSAACAAIIMPFMIDLEKRQLGTEKSIPTIIMMAASMDDVTAIAGFGVMMAFAFPQQQDSSSNVWMYARGPAEICAGVVIGFLAGSIIGILPFDLIYAGKERTALLMRVSLLVCAALASVFFSEQIDLRGAGPLSALTLAMFAASRLRRQDVSIDSISSAIHILWTVTQPLFFALIGTEADLRKELLQSNQYLSLCIGVVVIGMICRMFVTYASLMGSKLNRKEKAYISVVWLAKAAVQATVAPIALDVARKKGLELETGYATTIVIVSLIAILLSAPIASISMTLLDEVCLRVKAPVGEGVENPVFRVTPGYVV